MNSIRRTTLAGPDELTACGDYLDDRRGKGYSMTDGMGPLSSAWRTAARQTTSITAVATDATTVLYNDTGNNTGIGGAHWRDVGSPPAKLGNENPTRQRKGLKILVSVVRFRPGPPKNPCKTPTHAVGVLHSGYGLRQPGLSSTDSLCATLPWSCR